MDLIYNNKKMKKLPGDILCSVDSCNESFQKKNRDVSFHSFPLDNKDLLKKWINNIGRKNWEPSKNSRICSLHFERNLFYHGKKFKRLKKLAIPTIFDRDDDEYQETLNDENGDNKSEEAEDIEEVDSMDDKMSESECSSGFCSHYISLIEEKAKNHKLTRKVEEMEEQILYLEELLKEQETNKSVKDDEEEIP